MRLFSLNLLYFFCQILWYWYDLLYTGRFDFLVISADFSCCSIWLGNNLYSKLHFVYMYSLFYHTPYEIHKHTILCNRKFVTSCHYTIIRKSDFGTSFGFNIPRMVIYTIKAGASCDNAIVMFFFCFASDENPKNYQPAREKQTRNLNKTKTYLVNQLK